MLLLVSVALPILLVVNAVHSYRAVAGLREVYLKNRAATLALQLELTPADPLRIEQLVETELDVADIELFTSTLPDSHPDAAKVNAILDGRALYFSEEERPVYRSYLPIHHNGGGGFPEVARIETYSEAADFLVHDAMRHLSITVLAAAGALATLAAYLLDRAGFGSEDLGQVHAGVGDGDAAIAALERAALERSGSRSVLSMKVNPLYDFIRDDPRFVALIGSVGLAP